MFRNRFLTFAWALALIAVLGKFYAIPAIAQAARAALVQDRDNPARQPFSALVPTVNGTALSPAVPSGMRLIVTDMYFDYQGVPGLSCGAEVLAPGHQSFYALTDSPVFLTVGGVQTYAADHAFQIALDPGQSIQVNLACNIPAESGGGGQGKIVPYSEVSFAGYMIGIP
jgi:hypothetical protein